MISGRWSTICEPSHASPLVSASSFYMSASDTRTRRHVPCGDAVRLVVPRFAADAKNKLRGSKGKKIPCYLKARMVNSGNYKLFRKTLRNQDCPELMSVGDIMTTVFRTSSSILTVRHIRFANQPVIYRLFSPISYLSLHGSVRAPPH